MNGAASHRGRSTSPLTSDYERIRRRALPRGAFPTQESAGFGLVLRRGMLLWMRTAGALDVKISPSHYSDEPFSSALEGELVHVLAALLLGAPTCAFS